MTPPEHFLIGISCANIFYSGLLIIKRNWFTYGKLLIIMGLVAISPDIDSFFGHYTSTDPFVGHRGMTHSFLGVLVISIAFTLFASVITVLFRLIIGYWKVIVRYFKKRDTGEVSDEIIREYILDPFLLNKFFLFLLLCFISGTTHLITDLPQPPSVWKGIPLFFPLKSNGEFVRSGGWSLIGWYDLKIMWVLIGTTVLTVPSVLIGRAADLFKLRYASIPLLSVVILFNCAVFVWMGSYIASSTYTNSRKWAAYQNEMVKTFPPEIREVTMKGKTIFISLFRQMRRLK